MGKQVEKSAQSLVVAFEIRRKLDKQHAQPVRFNHRHQTCEHKVHRLNRLRFKSSHMTDALVCLETETEVFGCLLDPFGNGILSRILIKGSIHLERFVSRRVVLEKFRCRHVGRIEAAFTLPSWIRKSGKTNVKGGHA